MRKPIPAIALTFIMVFAVSTAFAANTAVLQDVKGSVQVKGTTVQPWEDAGNGQILNEGATIKTGPGGEAVVVWSKDRAVKVGPLSNIELESLTAKKSKINLSDGKIFARAAKLKSSESFEVRTPTAIAGVRGTGFEATPGSFAVVEGTVAVTAGGVEVVVGPGMMTEIPEAGAPPAQPSAIPATKLEQLKQTNAGVAKIAETAAPATTDADSEKPVDDVVEEVNDDVEQVTINDDLANEASNIQFDPGTGGIQGNINY